MKIVYLYIMHLCKPKNQKSQVNTRKKVISYKIWAPNTQNPTPNPTVTVAVHDGNVAAPEHIVVRLRGLPIVLATAIAVAAVRIPITNVAFLVFLCPNTKAKRVPYRECAIVYRRRAFRPL